MSSRDVLFQKSTSDSRGDRKSNYGKERLARWQAKVMFDCANGPPTWQADGLLMLTACFTIPDILVKQAAVTGSYFEWVQTCNVFWRESEVNDRLLDVMENSFDQVCRYGKRQSEQPIAAHGGH